MRLPRSESEGWIGVSSHCKVFAAVDSLYDDEVEPTVGIVRRRVEELGGPVLPFDVIEKMVQAAPWGELDESRGERNRIVRLFRPAHFVDPLGPDEYTEQWQVWDAAMAILAQRQAEFPGSRYSCAQALGHCGEFARFTLGRRQHIVQLCLKRGSLKYVETKRTPNRKQGPPTIMPVAIVAVPGRGALSEQQVPTGQTGTKAPAPRAASDPEVGAESPEPERYPRLLGPEQADREAKDARAKVRRELAPPQDRKWGPRCSGRLGSGVAEVREPVCSFAELEAQEAVRIEVRHTFVHIAAVAPSRRCQSLPVDGLSAAE